MSRLDKTHPSVLEALDKPQVIVLNVTLHEMDGSLAGLTLLASLMLESLKGAVESRTPDSSSMEVSDDLP